MSTISPAISALTFGNIQSLGTQKLNARKLSPEEIAEFRKLEEPPKIDPSIIPDNDPSNIYAVVKVDGEIVATLYKGGSVMMPNAIYAKTSKLPSMTEAETLTGQPLADKRAQEIADKLGGIIEKVSGTDQAATDAGAKTKFDAQSIAQADNPESDSVVSRFMDFMDSAHKGIGAFIRAQMLASKGMTEEDFAALPPEEQQKINEEIRKAIEEAIRKEAENKAWQAAML